MALLGARWGFGRRRAFPGIVTPDRPDKVWYLRQTSLFERLGEPELRRLAMQTEMREYPRGRVILGSNPNPEVVYFVKSGRVKISTSSTDGREQILALLERGDLFGELTSQEMPSSTRVEAFDQCVVCTLHRPIFEEVVRRSPEVGIQVIRVLARRLRAAEQTVEDLGLRDVPGRLASLLLRLAEEYGEHDGAGIRLSFRLTHQDIAHMVGSTRETVTTVMSRFREDGLIAVEQRILIILDLEKLGIIASTRRS